MVPALVAAGEAALEASAGGALLENVAGVAGRLGTFHDVIQLITARADDDNQGC